MTRADLHAHSLCSDGVYEPEYLAERAERLQLSAAAITDHDTAAGVARFAAAARAVGVTPVAGIEISSYDGREIHILGFNINTEAAGFAERMAELSRLRTERMRQIVAKLNALGFQMEFSELRAAARNSISRAHVAALMTGKGYVKDFREAMDKYLEAGKPAFVECSAVPPSLAVEIVRSAGGIPVLAHPGRLRIPGEEMTELIDGLRERGLMGIESSYPAHSKEQTRFFRAAAKRFGLINTAGSDFHRTEKPSVNYELDEAAVKMLGL